MAQTNVMVSYAPARRALAPAPRSETYDFRHKRLGLTLAGALLAGGAVFALGAYVRSDGSVREAFSPMRTSPSLGNAAPERVAARAAPPRASDPAAIRPSPLPYLAVVRNSPASPSAPRVETRTLSAPAPQEASRSPRQVALRAVSSPGQVQGEPTEATGLAPPAAPEPPSGQRRDLEGFLSEQGLVLAADAAQPALSADIPPVAEWTSGDLVVETPPEPALAAAPSFAEGAAPAPEPGTAPVLELTELAPAPAPAPAPLVDASPEAAPAPAADAVRLAAPEPGSIELPPAAPARSSAPIPFGEVGRAAPRLALAPAAAVATPASAAAPSASYVQHFPTAVVHGETLGAVTLRDLGAQGQMVHLGALVGLLKLRMPEAEFVRLGSAAAADRFVPLDQLRAAGITVQFDARKGRLLIDAR